MIMVSDDATTNLAPKGQMSLMMGTFFLGSVSQASVVDVV
jgi:hypothetical protein